MKRLPLLPMIHIRPLFLCGLAISGVFPCIAGCRKPAPAPARTAANGSIKLTPEQVNSRIRDLQANKTIPESVKPEIIRTIQAQGQ
ncbi:MAG: hypothetical protein V4671_32395 [Armatimonadota bacterium]